MSQFFWPEEPLLARICRKQNPKRQWRHARRSGGTVRNVVRIKVRQSRGGEEWKNSGWEHRLSVHIEPSRALWNIEAHAPPFMAMQWSALT
jgi:hypothetical protein